MSEASSGAVNVKVISCTCLIFVTLLFLVGCENFQNKVYDKAKKNPAVDDPVDAHIAREKSSDIHHDLVTLPKPKGKVVVSVYNFRDQSGQYQPQPANAFSTAMPQGTLPMLMKALRESGWFNLVEREGLQNLLTERKILRATNEKMLKNSNISPLAPANIIIEGGILAYDSNIKTGGSGAKYFGLSASSQYREDKVTVGLRVVDVNTGRIINTVTAQRKLMSTQVMGGLFRFIRYKRLLELETGVTQNDPAQVVVTDAIEAAVVKLVVSGIMQGNWHLRSLNAAYHPIFLSYADEFEYQEFLSKVSDLRKKPEPAGSVPKDQQGIEAILSEIAEEKVEANQKSIVGISGNAEVPNSGQQKKISSKKSSRIKKESTSIRSLDLYPVVEVLDTDDLFAIQVFNGETHADASAFVQRFRPHYERLWIWKLPHEGGVWYLVLAGQYDNKEAAFRDLSLLPQALQILGPWIRPLKGY